MSEKNTLPNTQNIVKADELTLYSKTGMQNILATVEIIRKFYGDDTAHDMFIVLERHMRLGTLHDNLEHMVNWSKMYARGMRKDRIKSRNFSETKPLEPWHEEIISSRDNVDAHVLLGEVLDTYRGKVLYQYVKTGLKRVTRARISQMRKELKAYVNS